MLTLDAMELTWGDFTLTADLSIETGDKVAVLGPSGAGKSTLLSMIAGFLPCAGRVLWQGEDLTALPPAQRPMTTIFQDNNLFPHMTAAQNVGLGLRPAPRLSSGEKRQVEEALVHVGLSGLGTRKPAQLSGGQVARVALARAILRKSPVMLLDEPFGALGPALREEMLDLVNRIVEETGATLLMVSHEPGDARRIADQVILVADGRAHPPVPTADIFENPPVALRDYLGSSAVSRTP